MSRSARRRLHAAFALVLAASLSATSVAADVYYPPGVPDGETFTPPPDPTPGAASTRCQRNASNTAGWGVATQNSRLPAGTVVNLPYSVNLTELENTKPSLTSPSAVSNRFGPPCGSVDHLSMTYCTTGYDIWRFYGKVRKDSTGSNRSGSAPVMVVSHSTVSFDAWCRPNYSRPQWSRIALFSPDPVDGQGPGRMWDRRDENRRGETFAMTEALSVNKPGMFTTTGTSLQGPDRDVCAQLATTPNPASKVLTDPAQPDYPARREELRRRYVAWRTKHGAALAEKLANLRPGTDPTNPAANLTTGFGDGIECASGYEYTVSPSSQDIPVFGVCALPVERYTTLWRRNGDLIAGFPTVANSGGSRYQVPGLRSGRAKEYPLFSLNAGADPRLNQPTVPGTRTAWYHGTWRQAAAAEYLTRTGNLGERRPGDPYLAEADTQRFTGQGFDTARAARVIAKYAICGNGSYLAFPESDISLTPKPTMTVELSTGGDAFEVRGDRSAQKLTLTPNVDCVDCVNPDPDAPSWFISSFSAKLRITGTNGYLSQRMDPERAGPMQIEPDDGYRVRAVSGAMWQNSRRLRAQAPDPTACGERCDVTEISLTATDLSAEELETLIAELFFYRSTKINLDRSRVDLDQKVRVEVLSLAAEVTTFHKNPTYTPLILPDGSYLLDEDDNPVLLKYFAPTKTQVPVPPLPDPVVRPVVSGSADPGR